MDLVSQRQPRSSEFLALAAGWASLLLVGVWSYYPGLGGPFVFDDFGSLTPLGDLGGVRDWTSFKAFVFGGHAGPTGRPLALLSFLIDATTWPADPWAFKRTNLVVHLANGVLLGAVTVKILSALEFDRRPARRIALVAAACWILHPFLVSTTLYSVQRMAQLATLFCFAGLLSYLHFRARLATNATTSYVGMSVSIVLFTFLAMVSKENGILLPLLVGVIEMTIMASRKVGHAPLNRYWTMAFIGLPSIVIALYLGKWLLRADIFDIVPPRDFSTVERLLTQPRILVDYLRHWFLPELYTSGVFQDHFVKSTGILSPATTLASLLLHVAAIALALIKRRDWPLLAFAILFFYGSHLLESTVIKLELYFEHRNYLAAAFLLLPFIAAVQRRANGKLFLVASVAALLLLASFTRYTSTIWGSYDTMVTASAKKAPTSARAQSQYASNLFNAEQYDDAYRVIETAIENIPHDVSLRIVRSTILCEVGALNSELFADDADALSGSIFDPRSINMYTTLVVSVTEGRCPGVDNDSLRAVFENMLQVPQNGNPGSLRYSQIQYFVGLIDVKSQRPKQAMLAFEASLGARPGPEHAMAMAALLATNEFFDEALQLSARALKHLDALPAYSRGALLVRRDDILEFRNTVRAEMESAAD